MFIKIEDPENEERLKQGDIIYKDGVVGMLVQCVGGDSPFYIVDMNSGDCIFSLDHRDLAQAVGWRKCKIQFNEWLKDYTSIGALKDKKY